jgi:hypothetical protein
MLSGGDRLLDLPFMQGMRRGEDHRFDAPIR